MPHHDSRTYISCEVKIPSAACNDFELQFYRPFHLYPPRSLSSRYYSANLGKSLPASSNLVIHGASYTDSLFKRYLLLVSPRCKQLIYQVIIRIQQHIRLKTCSHGPGSKCSVTFSSPRLYSLPIKQPCSNSPGSCLSLRLAHPATSPGLCPSF